MYIYEKSLKKFQKEIKISIFFQKKEKIIK